MKVKSKQRQDGQVHEEAQEAAEAAPEARVTNDGESEEDEVNVKQKKPIHVKDDPEKLKRTVFVGNLPISVTPRDLKKAFRTFGSIESVRLRGVTPNKLSIPKKVAVIKKMVHKERDNCNGYVVFKKQESVAESMAMNGHEMDGHHIRVDRMGESNLFNDSHSVFVGNLPMNVKDDDVWKTFSGCGEVSGVRIVRDSTTGLGKGFGFVMFKTKDSVILALEMNLQNHFGRELRITRADRKKEKQRKATAAPFRGKGKGRDAVDKKPRTRDRKKGAKLSEAEPASGSTFAGVSSNSRSKFSKNKNKKKTSGSKRKELNLQKVAQVLNK